jgi:hypothetical protein
VTLTGGMSGLHPIPSLSLAVAAGRTKSWSEAYQVVRTEFSNISPRQKFVMNFSSLPGSKHVPDTLAIAVLITFPGTPAPFNIEFQFKCRDASDR